MSDSTITKLRTSENSNPISSGLGRRPKPERGDRLELTTQSLAFEGKAVARREDGYVIFVEGAVARERVIAEIKKSKGSYAEAYLVSVLDAGPDRRTPICPYFGTCGGCAMQHLTYSAQLAAKRQQVIDLFQRVGMIPDPPVREVLAAPEEYHYRNKMEFSFSNERWLTEEEIGSSTVQDRFALGLHVRERFDRVIDTKACFLPKPIVTDILDFTRRFAIENHLAVYAPDKKTAVPSPAVTQDSNSGPDTPDPGLLRFLVVKTSHATGEVMVNLVTRQEAPELLIRYAKELMLTVPAVTTIVNTINSRRSQVATGEYEIVYHGDGTIRDAIGGATYRISANSFFQANTPQAERLYTLAANFAELEPDDIVWDLYCGTGTISIFVAPKVRHVLGLELVEAAIADARANAIANDITNVDFIAGDLKNILNSNSAHRIPDIQRPTAMIIDPPRSGMHPEVIREVLKLAPERISYISCNPATQARDVALLLDAYELVELQPVDMFPQTYHIECVAKLVWKGARNVDR